jgi:CMP-N-acetylneuraminic acid synthetase
MVPAKIASTRLPMKNLALIGGKPLIYYPIKAAKESGVFDQIVINAEDRAFSKIAKRYSVDFYKRPDSIVGSTTKTDTVVYDFLKNKPCDIVAWVSPIAPFETGQEVRAIAEYFIRENLDSLMTVKDVQVHCIYNGRPVNFRMDKVFAQTQDLIPMQTFVYSVMMWRSDAFMRTFEKRGHAVLCGKVGFYPVSKLSSIIIKTKEDLMLAGYILKSLSRQSSYKVSYDKIIKRRK